MASVFHLCCDSHDIKQKIVLKYWDFAESDKKLYFSSVAIQRTWRGYVARKIIKNWNAKATTIQRHIRGWLVRFNLPQYYSQYYYDLSAAVYNAQATRIQSFWRGYWTRKITLSLKKLRAGRQEINTSSIRMQGQMKEFFKELRKSHWDEEQQYLKKIVKLLFDRHHLLRTKVQEGIFSIHGSEKLSPVEKILKEFPLTEYMKEMRCQEVNEKKNLKKSRKKPFSLNAKIQSKPYERMLFTQD